MAQLEGEGTDRRFWPAVTGMEASQPSRAPLCACSCCSGVVCPRQSRAAVGQGLCASWLHSGLHYLHEERLPRCAAELPHHAVHLLGVRAEEGHGGRSNS